MSHPTTAASSLDTMSNPGPSTSTPTLPPANISIQGPSTRLYNPRLPLPPHHPRNPLHPPQQHPRPRSINTSPPPPSSDRPLSKATLKSTTPPASRREPQNRKRRPRVDDVCAVRLRKVEGHVGDEEREGLGEDGREGGEDYERAVLAEGGIEAGEAVCWAGEEDGAGGGLGGERHFAVGGYDCNACGVSFSFSTGGCGRREGGWKGREAYWRRRATQMLSRRRRPQRGNRAPKPWLFMNILKCELAPRSTEMW